MSKTAGEILRRPWKGNLEFYCLVDKKKVPITSGYLIKTKNNR
jgi:hypothetical protein